MDSALTMNSALTDVAPEAGAATPLGLELSRGNHFRFGYDGQWFTARRDRAQSWTVAYGRATRAVGDWRSECVATARMLRETTGQDLWVLFSGGIDSEVVLQSFLFAGIPVQAAITRFGNDLNRHDIVHAIAFCEAHQLRYRLVDLDIERFFDSGLAYDYAARSRCVQPQLLHTMWTMDQLEGYPILGSGECYLERRAAAPGEADATASGGIWEMHEKERIAAWYRHLIARGCAGCAGFFQFNPENMLAFLRDGAVAALCDDRFPGLDATTRIKAAIYRRHFLLAPRPKYSGFENVMHLDDALRPELERDFGDHDAIARRSYAALLRELAP
jgi:hypothetical protein